MSTWYFKPRSTAHGRINTVTAQPYLVHFKIITVSAIPNRTFSLHNSMSLSGNWFMKVTGMPGVAIIALIQQWVYTQFGGPHFLLIYLIRQKKRISFESSSFLLTNCKLIESSQRNTPRWLFLTLAQKFKQYSLMDWIHIATDIPRCVK